MSEQLTHIIDRSKWKKGEWDAEPDRADFTYAGFPCLLLRNHYGTWCGYVGVPPTHPAYKQGYDSVNVDVHGGLTYSNKCSPPICHVPKDGESDDVWWLGFDTGHYMDISPIDWQRMGLDMNLKDHGSYKNMRYVVNETEHLADQLKAYK